MKWFLINEFLVGQRVREVEQVRKEHPSKVPVIIERYRHENQLPPLDRSKFLIPERKQWVVTHVLV